MDLLLADLIFCKVQNQVVFQRGVTKFLKSLEIHFLSTVHGRLEIFGFQTLPKIFLFFGYPHLDLPDITTVGDAENLGFSTKNLIFEMLKTTCILSDSFLGWHL